MKIKRQFHEKKKTEFIRYNPIDKMVNTNEAIYSKVEFLNPFYPSGFPPDKLNLPYWGNDYDRCPADKIALIKNKTLVLTDLPGTFKKHSFPSECVLP